MYFILSIKTINCTESPENVLRRCRINTEGARYLSATKQLLSNLERREELREAFEICYSTIRKHIAHTDGSFRCVGETSEQSLWLTAFTIATLQQLKLLINIDDNYIKRGLDFLVKMQNEDGSFPDKTANYWFFRNRSNYDISLNAYILIAFMESRFHDEYKSTIDKTLKYVLNEDIHDEDNYGLSIVAWALSLKNIQLAKPLQERLMRNSIESSNYLFWHQFFKKEKDIYPNSYTLEIGSYAMMSFINTGDIVKAIKIMSDVILNPFHNNYIHTMDTIVTIGALTKISQILIDSPKTDMKFQFTNDDSVVGASFLNSNTSMFNLTKINLTSSNHLKMTSEGIGNAYVVLEAEYIFDYKTKNPTDDQFQVSIIPKSNEKNQLLEVCVSFIYETIKARQVAIQINNRHGFQSDTLSHYKKGNHTVSYQRDDRILVVFDEIDFQKKCIIIPIENGKNETHFETISIFTYEMEAPENFQIKYFSPEINDGC